MKFFNNKLHLLVNNAGHGQHIPVTKPIECYKTYKKIMAININAVVKLTLLCSQALKDTSLKMKKPTNIVNIGSIAGLRPCITLFSYSTSKAALNMFSQSLAIELSPYVRVNVVSAGPIETKIIERAGWELEKFKELANTNAPLKRIGHSDEVANCVLFLADLDKAAYITGANLIVDGGCSIAYNLHMK